MRARTWLTGVVVAAVCAAWQPAPARAAIWPFSLFGAKKAPAKKTKAKQQGKQKYNTRNKQVKPMH